MEGSPPRKYIFCCLKNMSNSTRISQNCGQVWRQIFGFWLFAVGIWLKVQTRITYWWGYYIGSVALLSHNTLKWSAILGLSFLYGANGPGNPCYGVQVRLVNFALHFKKRIALFWHNAKVLALLKVKCEIDSVRLNPIAWIPWATNTAQKTKSQNRTSL